MKESKTGKGVGNILVAQLLLGILIFVAVTVYPSDPKVALTIIYILILGIMFFSWKGLKGLWRKEPEPPAPRGPDKNR